MQTQTEWLAERRTGIGGSEAAAVFNVGWGCARQLAYDKRQIPSDFPFDETLAMQLGTALEPFFADQYSKITGRTLSAPASLFHPTHPELRVNVDRLIEPVPEHKGPGVLEIKSQGRAVFAKTKREGIASAYILQVQWALVVTGYEWGSFAIGCRDSGEMLRWDVDRSEAICAEILSAGPKLWALIQSDAELPDRLEIDDTRCCSCKWRQTCQGDALIHVQADSELVSIEDVRPLLVEYDARKALLSEAEDLMGETEEVLKTALVDRPAGHLKWGDGDRRVYYRPQKGRVTWQSSEMAKAYGKARMLARSASEEPARFDSEFPKVETYRRQGVPFRTLRVF